MSTVTIPLRTREAIEQEIERRLDAERSRLQASIAAQRPRTHFQRPVERPFTAAERDPAVSVVAPHALCLEEVRYPPDDQLSQRALATRRVREARGTGG